MDRDSNYDPIPPQQQLSITPPPLVAAVVAEEDVPFRVDGYRGLHDNYGSLYQVADMRGISPLYLEGPYSLINPDLINPRAWELFAVKYVYTDWQKLPVKSDIITTGQDRYGTVNLHQLADPRPFALVVYRHALAGSDQDAYTLLTDPIFDARRTVILNREPGIPNDDNAPPNSRAVVKTFKPESFTIITDITANGILSVSHPDYPGWQATIDGQPADILRAYGALSAVVVPAGKHTIEFSYNPLTYRIGEIISVLVWIGVLLASVILLIRSRHAGIESLTDVGQ
jgi:hypothetical protein